MDVAPACDSTSQLDKPGLNTFLVVMFATAVAAGEGNIARCDVITLHTTNDSRVVCCVAHVLV